MMRALIPLLLSPALFLCCAHAQNSPTSTPFYFQNLPAKVYVFEGTTNVLYHDAVEGIVHVSDDEGKTFMKAEGVPAGAAAALIEHPFDSTVAFILGKQTTHWKTKDRGKTWQSFASPDPVDLSSNALGFHIDQQYSGHVILQVRRCPARSFGICSSHTYYTTDLFDSEPRLLFDHVKNCLFAHSDKEFKHAAPLDLIFCITFYQQSPIKRSTLESGRIIQSTDFFKNDLKIVSVPELGEKKSRGVFSLAVTGRFLIAVASDLDAPPTGGNTMHLFVTADADTWAKAQFPHPSSSTMLPLAFTLLRDVTHSLGVDVLRQPYSSIGALFVSNSNGTFFVESLPNTNRNQDGFVDFQAVYGLEGVAIANTVSNHEEVHSKYASKVLKSLITFDDGSSWSPIPCPAPSSPTCGIHFHSVTNQHTFGRVFSSPAPGYVVGVGSVGSQLLPYEDSSTLVSDDGGLSWTVIDAGPMKYEIGGKGTVMVFVRDTDYVDGIHYSLDGGESLRELKFSDGLSVRAKALLTLPDLTSSKFLLIASLKPNDRVGQRNHVSIVLDFKDIWNRDCDISPGNQDIEKWYARSGTKSDCVMGHKQFYWRRRQLAQCNVGPKFDDRKNIEEDCECTADDYECDYNFVRSGTECVAVGPIPVEDDLYLKGTSRSSGYRKIPGNTCVGGVKLDGPIEKESYRDEKGDQRVFDTGIGGE